MAMGDVNGGSTGERAAGWGMAPTDGPGAALVGSEHGPGSLRARLIAVDTAACCAAWGLLLSMSQVGSGAATAPALVASSAAATISVIAVGRLYRSRVAAIRGVELNRLAPAAAMGALPLAVDAAMADVPLPVAEMALLVVVAFVFLVLGRSAFDAWLRSRRLRGEFCRPVVLVGVTEEAREVHRLLLDHPELGYRVVGVVGHEPEVGEWPADVPWLGPLDRIAEATAGCGANGVVICRDGIPGSLLNRTIRDLTVRGVHVQVAGGVWGFDHRRVHTVPVGHEPFLYVEPPRSGPAQATLKRGLDMVVATAALVVLSPLLVAAAAAVRLGDGGPALFHQERVGRGEKPFKLLKLRTMKPGAAGLLHQVQGGNGREGPLFKSAGADPRVTRVGRFLRLTSIDELPQLLNVLRGDMSLVGPRPALPSEIIHFDDDLRRRHLVKPGITGLWQVEARDNPSFRPYRRLDLFYVENLSLGLDLVILVLTVQVVVARALRGLASRGSGALLPAPAGGQRALTTPLGGVPVEAPGADVGAAGQGRDAAAVEGSPPLEAADRTDLELSAHRRPRDFARGAQ